MKSASLQTADLSKASSLSTWKANTKVVTRNVGSLQKQWLNSASLYLVLSNITCPPGQRFCRTVDMRWFDDWPNYFSWKIDCCDFLKRPSKKVHHCPPFNTKSLPFRFEIQPQDEIEDIQVDPFSSLPPTMSSFIVPSAFTSLAFDHQPSSMPSSPAFHGVKQRPPMMGSLNREASQRQLMILIWCF